MQGVPKGPSPAPNNSSAQPLANAEELLRQLLHEVRAMRQTQEHQSKRINDIMGGVDFMERNLSEHIYGGPDRVRELVNDDTEQEIKDLGFKRAE